MVYKKWTQQEIDDLISEPLEVSCKKHQNKTRNQLRVLRNYYRNKRSTVEQEPNPTANQTTVEQTDEALVSTIEGWYEVVTKDAEGIAQVHRLYKHSTKTRPLTNNSLVEPVVPAIIRRDRRRPPKRTYDSIFVFSDAQIGYRRIDDELIPIHHEPSIKAAQLLCAALRPNYVVDAGDTTDFAELSRFPADSDHFQGTLQPSMQRTHNMFAEFTAASPDAERFTVWSNHVKRLGDFLLKNAPQLARLKAVGEEHPAMSYQALLKLKDIGWNWVEGYGNHYDHKGRGDLAIIHGEFAVSNGSTAAKLSKANYGRHIVQGHKHSIETHYHTDRQGNQWGAFVVGALCRRDGYVPSYHSAIGNGNRPMTRYENWQNGVMLIKDYGPGEYQFEHIPINNGRINYNGVIYDGNE